MARAVASRSLRSRPVRTTLAPNSASLREIAEPMPRPLAVTTAIWVDKGLVSFTFHLNDVANGPESIGCADFGILRNKASGELGLQLAISVVHTYNPAHRNIP